MNIVNAFYRCRDSLVARNLCPCAACQYIAELDVKIIVHRGGVVHYRIGGMQDLSGMAVIEAHRLLKNSVGRPRYVLVTEAAGEVSLPWERSDGAHAQTYDEIGEIRYDVYLFEPPLPDVAATRAHVPVREKTGDLGAKFARNVRTLANNLRRL